MQIEQTIKKYDKYKDSGIEWIGEIPQEWNLYKLKHISNCNQEVLSEDTDSNQIINYIEIGSVTNEKGITDYQTLTFENAPSRARRIVKNGDTIISTVRTYLKAIAYIDDKYDKFICSTGFAVFDPNEKVLPKFLFYALQSEWFVSTVEANSVGISYPAINTTNLINYKIVLPPIKEQEEIMHYLDKKCGEIDGVIETEKSVIEKLKEYKQSIITEAVTKGLDKSTPLKDSGIEWIGKIPQHWEIGKIKHKFYLSSEENNDENATLLSLFTHIGVRPRAEMEDKGNKAQTVIGYSLVRKGDIIVNKLLAWMGAIGLSDYNGATSPDYDIYRLRDLKNDCPMFYHYLFRSCNFKDECYKYGRGIMLMRLRTYPEEFLNIYIPKVSKEEQKQIPLHSI